MDPIILDIMLVSSLDERTDAFALSFACMAWTLVDIDVGVVPWLRTAGAGGSG